MLRLRAGPTGRRTTGDGLGTGDFRGGDLGRTSRADAHATGHERGLGLAGGEDLGGGGRADLGGAQPGICTDDGGADGQADDATALFGLEQLGPRAFLGAAEPAPEIEFEGGRQGGALVGADATVQGEIGIEAAFADLDLLRRHVGVDLRQAGAFDLAEHGAGFGHPRDGHAEVRVGREGFRDERVEFRIGERLPPFGADGDTALPGFGIGIGRGRHGTLVVRTEGAAGKQAGDEEHRKGGLHGWTTAFSLRPERRWKNQGMKSVATKVSRSMPPSTPVPMD